MNKGNSFGYNNKAIIKSEYKGFACKPNIRKLSSSGVNTKICNFHGWKGGKNSQRCPECTDIENKISEKLGHSKFRNIAGIDYIECSNSSDGIRIWLRCNMGHKLTYTMKEIHRGCRICSSEKYLSPKYRNNAIKLDIKKEEEYRRKQGELIAEAKELFEKKSRNCHTQSIDLEVQKCIESYPNVPYETAHAITYILKFGYEPYKLFQVPNTITPENKISILKRISSFFRAQARLIHPDKNNHPKSADAFQILSNAYNQIKNYVENKM
ncbi:DnaJ domain protein [Cryptosporidium felis]|nr:DnaJ domain protein [Cryptosporidium felis]